MGRYSGILFLKQFQNNRPQKAMEAISKRRNKSLVLRVKAFITFDLAMIRFIAVRTQRYLRKLHHEDGVGSYSLITFSDLLFDVDSVSLIDVPRRQVVLSG